MIGGWVGQHADIVLGFGIGLVSEVLALMNALKYPTNQGAGGVVAGILKFLKIIKATNSVN